MVRFVTAWSPILSSVIALPSILGPVIALASILEVSTVFSNASAPELSIKLESDAEAPPAKKL